MVCLAMLAGSTRRVSVRFLSSSLSLEREPIDLMPTGPRFGAPSVPYVSLPFWAKVS